jgi:FlaA1/EpsC-like NDP-sugar epimerase
VDDVTMMGSEPAAVTLDGSGVPPTEPARAPAHTLRASTSARARDYILAIALDIAIVTAAFELATVLRFLDNPADIGANVARMLLPSLLVASVYAICAVLLGVHRRIWKYASLREGLLLVEAVLFTLVIGAGLDYFGAPQLRTIRPSVLIGGALFTLVLLGSVKMLPRVARLWHVTQAAGGEMRVLIVGAGEVGAEIASRLLSARTRSYRVVAFVDDDPAKWTRRIHGRPILGAIETIPAVVARHRIDLIAVALPSAGPERISQIIATCQETNARVQVYPGLRELVGMDWRAARLREVDIADLLGREVIPLPAEEAREALAGKVVLVTGAAGSIGAELCRQIADLGPAKLIALDNNETGLFDLAESLRGSAASACLSPCIADITDREGIERIFSGQRPDVVFHAAAYKHVPLLEAHAGQAIRTNVLATYALCMAAQNAGVATFVFVSTDKAADPINVLGASKRAGELIVGALAQAGQGQTRFCSVRFGNVIGSRGSVVPTFLKQIEQGGPVTVTDLAATRYFMTIPEACGLVILTAAMADSGGLYLLDMGQPVRIADLAVKMIRLRGLRVGQDIAIVNTGLRPGEKLHETLVAADEEQRPTPHDEIFHLVGQGRSPHLEAISEWMCELESQVPRETNDALRERLLRLAQQVTLVH